MASVLLCYIFLFLKSDECCLQSVAKSSGFSISSVLELALSPLPEALPDSTPYRQPLGQLWSAWAPALFLLHIETLPHPAYLCQHGHHDPGCTSEAPKPPSHLPHITAGSGALACIRHACTPSQIPALLRAQTAPETPDGPWNFLGDIGARAVLQFAGSG